MLGSIPEKPSVESHETGNNSMRGGAHDGRIGSRAHLSAQKEQREGGVMRLASKTKFGGGYNRNGLA
jgi:hypothetical protein